MSTRLKVMLVLLVVFIAMQFFRPAINTNTKELQNDFEKRMNVPTDVAALLKTACYDCHSNNTRYPWYNNIQPVAWWLNDHVIDGKKELNFDEYINRRPRFQ